VSESLAVEERLRSAGLTEAEARRKRQLFADVEAALRSAAGEGAETRRWFVPGRIEVLGKHTDYAGGRSLLCTVGRGFCVAAAPRSDRTVRVADVAKGVTAEAPLDAALDPSACDWSVYLQTVTSRVAQNFPGTLRGAEIAFASDLPAASGLSSSSALIVALFSAIRAVNALDDRPEWRAAIRTPEDLAGYLGSVENGESFGPLAGRRGAGAFTGSEDQTAILSSRAGALAQYAFLPVRRERDVPLEKDWSFVVASSGVASDKTGAVKDRYNRVSLAARAILDLWNGSARRGDPSLYAAAHALPDSAERIRNLIRVIPIPGFDADYLRGRFDQLLEESDVLVPGVAEQLLRRDVLPIGPLVDRSQELAEKALQNQIPETIFLAREGRRLGAAAASAFGGGFGGSVWAIARTPEAEAFRRRWAERYAGEFPGTTSSARFFTTRPGPPLMEL
jgi:galactokinase